MRQLIVLCAIKTVNQLIIDHEQWTLSYVLSFPSVCHGNPFFSEADKVSYKDVCQMNYILPSVCVTKVLIITMAFLKVWIPCTTRESCYTSFQIPRWPATKVWTEKKLFSGIISHALSHGFVVSVIFKKLVPRWFLGHPQHITRTDHPTFERPGKKYSSNELFFFLYRYHFLWGWLKHFE